MLHLPPGECVKRSPNLICGSPIVIGSMQDTHICICIQQQLARLSLHYIYAITRSIRSNRCEEFLPEYNIRARPGLGDSGRLGQKMGREEIRRYI